MNLASKHSLTWLELGPLCTVGPGKAARAEVTLTSSRRSSARAGGEPTLRPEHALHEGLPIRPPCPVQQLSRCQLSVD